MKESTNAFSVELSQQLWKRMYPDEPPLVDERWVRAWCPGRVNLRGMHVDSHGGAVNSIALEQGTVCVASISSTGAFGDAGRVRVRSDRAPFQPVDFSLGPTDPWTDPRSPSNWSRYVYGALRAANEVISIAERLRQKSVAVAVHSTLPEGCGLSSSHALLVGLLLVFGEATGADLLKDASSVVRLCQRAERYAGAATGLGDQGAQLFARHGDVVHARFHPRFLDGAGHFQPVYAQFPPHLCVVVANTGEERSLSGPQRMQYALPRYGVSIGMAMLRKILEEADGPLETVAPERLYRALREIPEAIDPTVLSKSEWKEVEEAARADFLAGETHPPTQVDVRGPLVYVLSECARSDRFLRELRGTAQPAVLGKLMNVGHEGDSVTNPAKLAEAKLSEWIAMAEDGGSGPDDSALEWLPGQFGASTPLLDRIQASLVRLGAYGACLTGAGMGGVIVALVDASDAEGLSARLVQAALEADDVKLREWGALAKRSLDTENPFVFTSKASSPASIHIF